VEPLIFLAVIAVVFWFLLVRPQRRRRAEQRSLMAGISAGDEIVTAGGIFGTVRSIADDQIVLEIAPGTEVRVARQAVADVVRQTEEPPTTAEEHG
jgi:preprotein translocase subunit YajC